VTHGAACDAHGPQCEGAIASEGQNGRLTHGAACDGHGPQCEGAIASEGQNGRLTHGAACDGHGPHCDGKTVTGGVGCGAPAPPGTPAGAPGRCAALIAPMRKSACAVCVVTEPKLSVASVATHRIVPPSSGSVLACKTASLGTST
jgi:hypothetical protein